MCYHLEIVVKKGFGLNVPPCLEKRWWDRCRRELGIEWEVSFPEEYEFETVLLMMANDGDEDMMAVQHVRCWEVVAA